MAAERPHVVMIAGPNGAGKSTVAPGLLAGALGVVEFVNADLIARGLSGFDPDRAAFEAGRVMLGRIEYLSKQRVDFAFETTLGGSTITALLEKAIAWEIAVRIWYVGLATRSFIFNVSGHGLRPAATAFPNLTFENDSMPAA